MLCCDGLERYGSKYMEVEKQWRAVVTSTKIGSHTTWREDRQHRKRINVTYIDSRRSSKMHHGL